MRASRARRASDLPFGAAALLLASALVGSAIAQPGAPEVVSTATRAQPPAPIEPLGEATPIEDPSGHALDAFHAALRRAQAHAGFARIAFYGASHVASDLFTGRLRQRLQQRFGEAGPGFVITGQPWRYYRNSGVHFEQTRGWRTLRIKELAPKLELYGLAGAALDARRNKPASASFGTRRSVSSIEVYYWKQPNGGHIALLVDGKRVRRIATSSRHAEPGYARVEVADGEHEVQLTAEGDGLVRVFGAALERGKSGVVLDTLGVPGTRARDQLYWDAALYREHLGRRDPDLLVLAYGTNESGDDDVPIEQYAADLGKVVERARNAADHASCLLIGPSDRPVKENDGSFSPRPRTDEIIDVQRRVAAEHGCGFFDLRRFMGGPMSMLRWVAAVPPFGNSDHVHFTVAGYERLGNVLYDALLDGYSSSATPHDAPRAAR